MDALEPAREPSGKPGTSDPRRRRRLLTRLIAVVVAVALIVLALLAVTGLLGSQGSDDPGSPQRTGSAAVAQLVRDQGVRLDRITAVDDAAAAVRARGVGADGTRPVTLVVARPERVTAAEATELAATRPARLVLLTPDQTALQRFGVRAVTTGATLDQTAVAADCDDPAAVRAGDLTLSEAVGYRTDTGTSCYPSSVGAAYVVTSGAAGRIDLVGNPFRNRTLAQGGNASLATAVLGSQPDLVWLMTPVPTAAAADRPPALLPTWWLAAVGAAVAAVVVLGIWRGRRFGPIIAERLPVVVRAGETVDGHGRLYHRLDARDRAAAALRSGVLARLGPRYTAGSARPDPLLLARRLAERTGRDPRQVADWLAGPTPPDDDALNDLAHHLDTLEQEARQL